MNVICRSADPCPWPAGGTPVSTSHKWTFLSSDADATVRPSLDKATQLMPSVCSSMRCMGSPEFQTQWGIGVADTDRGWQTNGGAVGTQSAAVAARLHHALEGLRAPTGTPASDHVGLSCVVRGRGMRGSPFGHGTCCPPRAFSEHNLEAPSRQNQLGSHVARTAFDPTSCNSTGEPRHVLGKHVN